MPAQKSQDVYVYNYDTSYDEDGDMMDALAHSAMRDEIASQQLQQSLQQSNADYRARQKRDILFKQCMMGEGWSLVEVERDSTESQAPKKVQGSQSESLSEEEERQIYEELAKDLNKHYEPAPNAEEKWSKYVESLSEEEARKVLQGGPSTEELKDRSDFDNDGIRDSIDSDIDGDGKLNKEDPAPKNPYK